MVFFESFADEITKLAAEHIPGGEAKGLPDDVFDKRQLRMGTRVEKEHTPDPAKAKEIAKDHLAENIKKGEPQTYYTDLKRMEGAHKKAEEEEEERGRPLPPNAEKIIIEFFKAHPNPPDEKVHELAESLGVSPHVLESKIYSLLSGKL